MKRFEDIGLRLLNRTRGGGMTGDPIASVLGDPRKRAYAAQFIGQAFVTAYNLILANKDKVEKVADTVIEKQEIYGDDLVRLLDAQDFKRPEIDWADESVWPNLTWTGREGTGSRQPRARSAEDDGRVTGEISKGPEPRRARPEPSAETGHARRRRGSGPPALPARQGAVGPRCAPRMHGTGSSRRLHRPRHRPRRGHHRSRRAGDQAGPLASPAPGRPGSPPPAPPRRWRARSPTTSRTSTS